MALAPILLFVYNRPSHTRKVLEALRRNHLCTQSELFVFSDGYKANEEDKEAVLEVRQIVQAISGFKQKHIVENTSNKGLAANIIESVTSVVNNYGKAIVLEDDLITSPWFLTFMNEALDRFEEDDKIGHIHAFCYPDLGLPDTFLIKWTGSWGWATWKRAWSYFNADGKVLLDELQRRKLTKIFDFNGSYRYTRMLRRQTKGLNNSWAIRWNASLFLNDKLSLNAGKSLVQNIGFDGTGTHSGTQEIYSTPLCSQKLSIDVPEVAENPQARIAFERYYIKTTGFWAKVRRRIHRHLKI